MILTSKEVDDVLNKYELGDIFKALKEFTTTGMWPRPWPAWIDEIGKLCSGPFSKTWSANTISLLATNYVAEEAMRRLKELEERLNDVVHTDLERALRRE